MRILVVCWMPLVPSDAGYKKRVLSLYPKLSKDHDVLIVSQGNPPKSVPWREVGSRGGSLTESLFRHAVPKWRLARTFFGRYIRDVVRVAKEFKPDLIIAEGLWSAKAGRVAGEAAMAPVAITVQNIESVSAKGIYPSPICSGLASFEKRTYKRSDCLFCITEEEKTHVQGLVGPNCPPVWVVPNGTDLTTPPAEEDVADLLARWHVRPHEKVVLSVGKLDYPPNKKGLVWFSSDVFPHLPSDNVPCRWIVVGEPRPTSPIPPFEFVGYVDDLPITLHAADLCIAPIRHGSGSSIKVLDYLGSGRPVLATSHAVRGLPIEDGTHAFVRDDAKSFAMTAMELLSDSETLAELGKNGSELVRQQFTWETIAARLSSQIQEVPHP